MKGKDIKKSPEDHVAIIMDDLAFDKKMMKNECIREIFFNGRHYGITIIITFQYMMEIGPEYRGNIDYIFVYKEPRKDATDKLYKYFFSIFDKPVDFKKVLYSCTNDYGCLVLDNISKSYLIEDQVFWYRVDINSDRYINFKANPSLWPKYDLLYAKRKANEEKSTYDGNNSSRLIVTKRGPKDL